MTNICQNITQNVLRKLIYITHKTCCITTLHYENLYDADINSNKLKNNIG